MTVKDYIKLPYSRILIPEDTGYSCSVLEFPGCFSQGDTLEEAMNNINEAMELWIEASLDLGHKIPTPSILESSTSIETIKEYLSNKLIRLEDDPEYNNPMIKTKFGTYPNLKHTTIEYLRALLKISSHYEDY